MNIKEIIGFVLGVLCVIGAFIGLIVGLIAIAPPPKYKTDGVVEREVFEKCMSNLPTSPTSLTASGNDLDEMIEACALAATRIATKRVDN